VRSVSGIQKGAQFHTLHLILLGQINKTFWVLSGKEG
jgi:hypothetical protein